MYSSLRRNKNNVNILAESYIVKTSKVAASVVEEAAWRNNMKYECISRHNYIFPPLTVETMGPWSMETQIVFQKMLVDVSGDGKGIFGREFPSHFKGGILPAYCLP